MKIANPEKFSGTLLARRIPKGAPNAAELQERCIQTLLEIYNVDRNAIDISTNDIGMRLFRDLAKDVFPGMNIVSAKRRPKARDSYDCKRIYDMFHIAKLVTGKSRKEIINQLIKYESIRYGDIVTQSAIDDMLHRAVPTSLSLENLGSVFTEASTDRDAYDAQDVVQFLAYIACVKKGHILEKNKDPRSSKIYAKPIGKRKTD